MISLCLVPPVPPTLALRILNATAIDNTRVLAHVGSLLSISCEMTEAYTEGNLQVHWSAESGDIEIPTMKPSQTEVQLTIDKVDKEDEDRYTCLAINNEGSDLLSVNLVVGSVPEPLRVTAIPNNDAIIVAWEENTTNANLPPDEQITAYYLQYGPVNQSDDVVVRKYAASVQTTTLRDVTHGVEYIVTMWSQNSFGNSSESNSVSVVITVGMYE